MTTTPDKSAQPESLIFVSKGHVLLANMPPENISLGRILLFPFMEVEITSYFGEAYSPALSPLVKSYKANIYTEIPNALLEYVSDIHNRSQIEKLIRPVLEIRLIAHALYYQEPILFSFENTHQITLEERVPSDMTTLSISFLPDELRQFSVDQEYIFQGRTVPQQPVNRGLRAEEDLGNQRFTLVKPSGTGALLNNLHPQNMNWSVFKQINELYEAIKKSSADENLIKALDFLRRAVVQEKLGFHNEAYLNYFRIIEAFANSHGGQEIRTFLQKNFSLTEQEARVLTTARNKVVAHGDIESGFMREVGQQELYKIKECAISSIQHLLI